MGKVNMWHTARFKGKHGVNCFVINGHLTKPSKPNQTPELFICLFGSAFGY